MSHHHDHDHDHDHTHQHGSDHHHGHAHSHSPLSFSEKLIRLLDHWIQHNDHHAEDYRQWAQDARENGQTEVADLLESAIELTGSISDRLREAGGKVRPNPGA
jgi:hypothetical protein